MTQKELLELALACTPKQRTFVNAIVDGVGPSEAYRQAYNTNARDSALSSKAAKCQKSPCVIAYHAALVAQMERRRLLTRDRKREHLSAIAENDKAKASDRIRAIEVDNTMTGDNAPQKVEVFGLGELLAMVRKRRE